MPQHCPFSSRDPDPNLTQPKRHLDQFNRFCMAHGCIQQTDRPSYIDTNKPYLYLAYWCGQEMYKILGKLSWDCDIQNNNSNKKNKKKTKNKMYTPHHTISQTQTPQDWKTSKNRRKFLACMQTGIHYENARVNVTTQPVIREKQAVEHPRILPLPAPTSRTFQRKPAGENTAPSSQCFRKTVNR